MRGEKLVCTCLSVMVVFTFKLIMTKEKAFLILT
jgi:hypothetical protein